MPAQSLLMDQQAIAVRCQVVSECSQGMSDEDLQAWFVSAGGVARTCLKRAHTEGLDREQWLLEINDKLRAFKSREMLVCQPTPTCRCKLLSCLALHACRLSACKYAM